MSKKRYHRPSRAEQAQGRRIRKRTPQEWIAEIAKLEYRCLRGKIAQAVWFHYQPHKTVNQCDLPPGESKAWQSIRDAFPPVRRHILSPRRIELALLKIGVPPQKARSIAARKEYKCNTGKRKCRKTPKELDA